MKLNLTYWMVGLAFVVGAALPLRAQEINLPQAERFSPGGFALVTMGDRSFYIDTLGQRAFDHYDMEHKIQLGDREEIAKYDEFVKRHPDQLPKPVVIVMKDGLSGVLSPRGEWIALPEYQRIDTRFGDCWKVMKDGKQSFLAKEGLLLPFYDDVGYLDGRYFDVKSGAKWGIYDREKERLVVPAEYDKFDYCGGCGRKSDYIYAQRDGKWGIVGFDGKVRVPFHYEHSFHSGMRSDEWVRSFSKNGQAMVVHIPTGKEFISKGQRSLEILSGGILIVEVNGKYGLIDRNAEEVLPAEYDAINEPNENSYLGYYGPYAILTKGGRHGVYQSGVGVIIPVEWEQIRVYDDYFALTNDGYCGLYDASGQELVAPKYTEITHINNYFYSSGSKGVAIFKTKQKALHGLYFAENGKEIEPKFYEVDLIPFDRDGLDSLVVGEYQGEKTVYNFLGEEWLPSGYDSWSLWDTTSTRYIRVERAKKYGIYDTEKQQELIPVQFDAIRVFPGSTQLVLAISGDYGNYRYSVYSLDGQQVLASQYRDFAEVSGSGGIFSAGENEEKAIWIDGRKGNRTELPAKYVRSLGSTALVLASDDSTQGRLYHTERGKFVSKQRFAFTQTYEFSPYGVAWVLLDGKWGILDTAGQWVREPLYERMLDFNKQGVAVGAISYPPSDWRHQVRYVAYQFIGPAGKPLIDEVYTGPSDYLTDMDYFAAGYPVVQRSDGETGYLRVGLADTLGNVFIQPEYETVEAFNNGTCFLLSKDGKFGIADTHGQLILPVEFDNLLLDRYNNESGITFPVLANRHGKWQYYNRDGEVLSVEGVPHGEFSVKIGLW